MNTDKTTTLKTTLATNDLSLTKARLAVFKLLDNDQPQTIGQIQTKASGLVDRVTVYRNIELFEKIGIVRRIYIGWKYKLELSDKFLDHHHHLTCLNCGKTIDIKDEKHFDEFIGDISKEYNFNPSRHQFEIEGICRECSLTN
jgi:Fe2+ or Zn2+ uptake regulation protein